MIGNYFKVAYRNLKKDRLYAVLNILGLSLGITCALLIYLWISNELSYDKFHTKSGRIYLVYEKYRFSNSYATTALTPLPLAPLLKANLPGIENIVRLDLSIRNNQYFKIGDEIKETAAPGLIAFADSSFFNIFSFKLLAGNASTALSAPNSIVIAKSKAKNFFGDNDPLGKYITMTNVFNGLSMHLQVTGVMEDMPQNSHVHKDFLISMITADNLPSLQWRLGSWNYGGELSYILLSENANVERIGEMINNVVKNNADKWTRENRSFYLINLEDIYLKSDIDYNAVASGDIRYVYLFGIVAAFTLLIACVNYMNMATVRSLQRAKEVGIRKVVGAERGQLLKQFLTESFLTAFVALLLAYIFILIVFPYFNEIAGKQLSLKSVFSLRFVIASVPLLLIVSVVSGCYPAVYLSSFESIKVLKGTLTGFMNNARLRKVLVIFQFTASISLITATIIIYNQWQFLRNKKLGLDTTHIITLPVQSQDFIKRYEGIKAELLKNTAIKSVTACNKGIMEKFFDYASTYVNEDPNQLSMPFGAVDYDFFETFDIKLVKGRLFRKDFSSDSVSSIIINEAAAGMLGLKDPLGNILKIGSEKTGKRIIGVVKDFHFEDLHNRIVPTMFFISTSSFNAVYVKVSSNNIEKNISYIEDVFRRYNFSEPFQYSSLDAKVAERYKSEQRFFHIFSVFAVLSISIACLGLFSLAAFTAQQRAKEISIRKVVGASVGGIVQMLAGHFLKLTLIAALIACPVSWFVMSRWLQNFPYRINMSWWFYVLGDILALLMVFTTVSYHAVRAAIANPVKSLKSE